MRGSNGQDGGDSTETPQPIDKGLASFVETFSGSLIHPELFRGIPDDSESREWYLKTMRRAARKKSK